MSCIPLNVNRRLGITCRLNLQGGNICQGKPQNETGSKLLLSALCWQFLGLLFDLENGGDMFFRNTSILSSDYTVLYPRIHSFYKDNSNISLEESYMRLKCHSCTTPSDLKWPFEIQFQSCLFFRIPGSMCALSWRQSWSNHQLTSRKKNTRRETKTQLHHRLK